MPASTRTAKPATAPPTAGPIMFLDSPDLDSGMGGSEEEPPVDAVPLGAGLGEALVDVSEDVENVEVGASECVLSGRSVHVIR